MDKNLLNDGTYLQRRFEGCKQLAKTVMAHAQAAKRDPVIVKVYTPAIIAGGSWGFTTVKAWLSRGRYFVGYDMSDPSFTPQIYRRKRSDLPPGGVTNPTYMVYDTSIDQASEINRIEQNLRTIA